MRRMNPSFGFKLPGEGEVDGGKSGVVGYRFRLSSPVWLALLKCFQETVGLPFFALPPLNCFATGRRWEMRRGRMQTG